MFRCYDQTLFFQDRKIVDLSETSEMFVERTSFGYLHHLFELHPESREDFYDQPVTRSLCEQVLMEVAWAEFFKLQALLRIRIICDHLRISRIAFCSKVWPLIFPNLAPLFLGEAESTSSKYVNRIIRDIGYLPMTSVPEEALLDVENCKFIMRSMKNAFHKNWTVQTSAMSLSTGVGRRSQERIMLLGAEGSPGLVLQARLHEKDCGAQVFPVSLLRKTMSTTRRTFDVSLISSVDELPWLTWVEPFWLRVWLRGVASRALSPTGLRRSRRQPSDPWGR